MTQVGKECHQHCEIFHRVGDCIMPREGVFARVLRGGTIRDLLPGEKPHLAVPVPGVGVPFDAKVFDKLPLVNIGLYRALLRAGADRDKSGPVIRELLEAAGQYAVTQYVILPDEREQLRDTMAAWCDQGLVDLILTTGGTGRSISRRASREQPQRSRRAAAAQSSRFLSVRESEKEYLYWGIVTALGEAPTPLPTKEEILEQMEISRMM